MSESLHCVIKQRNQRVSDGISSIIRELPISTADPEAVLESLGVSAPLGAVRADDRKVKSLKHSKSGQQLKNTATPAKSSSKTGQDGETDKSSAWNLVDGILRPPTQEDLADLLPGHPDPLRDVAFYVPPIGSARDTLEAAPESAKSTLQLVEHARLSDLRAESPWEERGRKSRRIGSKQDSEARSRLKDGDAVGRGGAPTALDVELSAPPLDVLTPAELALLCLHTRALRGDEESDAEPMPPPKEALLQLTTGLRGSGGVNGTVHQHAPEGLVQQMKDWLRAQVPEVRTEMPAPMEVCAAEPAPEPVPPQPLPLSALPSLLQHYPPTVPQYLSQLQQYSAAAFLQQFGAMPGFSGSPFPSPPAIPPVAPPRPRGAVPLGWDLFDGAGQGVAQGIPVQPTPSQFSPHGVLPAFPYSLVFPGAVPLDAAHHLGVPVGSPPVQGLGLPGSVPAMPLGASPYGGPAVQTAAFPGQAVPTAAFPAPAVQNAIFPDPTGQNAAFPGLAVQNTALPSPVVPTAAYPGGGFGTQSAAVPASGPPVHSVAGLGNNPSAPSTAVPSSGPAGQSAAVPCSSPAELNTLMPGPGSADPTGTGSSLGNALQNGVGSAQQHAVLPDAAAPAAPSGVLSGSASAPQAAAAFGGPSAVRSGADVAGGFAAPADGSKEGSAVPAVGRTARGSSAAAIAAPGPQVAGAAAAQEKAWPAILGAKKQLTWTGKS
eukprot:jgi/Botrbrau1/8280/Bobra.0251s0009.1